MGRVLTAGDLLAVWERGLTQRPLERAISLLATSHPEAPLEQLREQPIGQRDAQLMEIREALFGPSLACLVACPKCGERLEIALDIAQFRALSSDTDISKIHTINASGYEIQFRLPNSADMQSIANVSDADPARRALFERCVQNSTREGAPVSTSDLPEEMVDAVSSRMAQMDPQADIQLALVCPACAAQWSMVFDIVSFLWSEIHAWAVRILREVHQLASAYGWREADILALSPMRRQFYLELIG